MRDAHTISFSEITTLNRCEKLWEYSYLKGLVPKREDGALSRGTVMHALLAAYARGENWRTYWEAARAAAMERAVLIEEAEEVERDFVLYAGVMERYVLWNGPMGKVQHIEESFRVPLPVGGTLKFKPDLVLVRDNGRLWLRDYKTKINFDKDMDLRADFDPQLSFYIWGLRREGLDVEGADLTYLRMRVPATPSINKDGTMSKARIVTDEKTVREFVAQSGVKIEPAALEAYIARLPQEAFFRRIVTVRSDEELEAISREIMLKAMRRDSLVDSEGLTTRTLIADCVRCPFLRPCLTSLKGGDEESILAESYRQRQEDEEAMPVDFDGGESSDGSGADSLIE